jgi:hypothetical protein
MSPSDSYYEGLSTVAEYVEQIGDEVADEIDATSDDGQQVDGFRCLHGTQPYVVIGSPQDQGMKIQFEVQLHTPLIPNVVQSDPDIASKIESQDEVEVEVTEQHHQQAQQLLASRLSSVDESNLMDVRQKLTEILSGTACGWEILPGDEPIILQFQVTKTIYPQSDEFNLPQFSDSVQTVISQGVAGHSFVASAYGLDTEEDQDQYSTSSEEPDSGPGPTAFQ